MPLHLKYRPQTLEEFFGNDSLKQSLDTILRREDRPRAFLFIGPSGCGKTTLARILANVFGCKGNDYQELNISDTRGIDDARKLISNMYFLPQDKESNYRFFVLDECQEATGNFQNAILKALEDTPKHVVFVLCTTDPQKLKPAIQTRCSTFEVQPLAGPILRQMLRKILVHEQVSLPDDVLMELTKVSNGSPRQALVILDQIIDIADDQELIQAIRQNRPTEATTKELCEALGKKKAWKDIATILKTFQKTSDWETIRREVQGYFLAVMLNADNPEAAKIVDCFRSSSFNPKADVILACYRAFRL